MTIKMAIRMRWMKERSRPASHFKYLCIMWWAPRVIFPEVERNRHANRSNTPASRRKEAVPAFPSPECAIRRHRVRSLISVHPDAPFGRREEPADRTTKLAMSWHERTHADTAASASRELVRRIVGEHRVKKSA